jgi:hypothetical protein
VLVPPTTPHDHLPTIITRTTDTKHKKKAKEAHNKPPQGKQQQAKWRFQRNDLSVHYHDDFIASMA